MARAGRSATALIGSAKAVSRAGTQDLQAVGGMSAQMAQAIYEFFHERRE